MRQRITAGLGCYPERLAGNQKRAVLLLKDDLLRRIKIPNWLPRQIEVLHHNINAAALHKDHHLKQRLTARLGCYGPSRVVDNHDLVAMLRRDENLEKCVNMGAAASKTQLALGENWSRASQYPCCSTTREPSLKAEAYRSTTIEPSLTLWNY